MAPLLALLQLCDSLFPIGGFGHSDGLEAATDAGLVAGGADLRDWMDASLREVFGRAEGPALLLAWRAFADGQCDALDELDACVYALRPSSASRQATRAMGGRLLATWQQLWPHASVATWMARRPGIGTTLPVAFAVASAGAGIDARSALTGYAYTRLAAAASAAMRLMPIGQHEAHGVLAGMLRLVPASVDGILERGDTPSAFAPALDVAAMSQQYVHSRLFKS